MSRILQPLFVTTSKREERNAEAAVMYKIKEIPLDGRHKKKKEDDKKDVENPVTAEDEEDQKKEMLDQGINVDKEKLRLEKKKRTQEDMVADFVKILEQMMNPRQALTSFMCGIAGIISVVVGTIYILQLPVVAWKARELALALVVYGILQVLLATAYFVTCMQTSIAVAKGVKDTLQIIIGIFVAGIYAVITFISLIVGIFGFYKALSLCSVVEYYDESSLTYCPKVEFYTALGVFVFHIITIVLKFCCCK